MSRDHSVSSRYEVLRLLGKGATAETLLCRDLERGGNLVAKKLFSPDFSRRRPDLIERELKTLSGLSHPHIAGIEDYSRDGEQVFLTCEYVDGPDLLEEAGKADLNHSLWLFAQVFEALDYLYFRNVVHLDIKPSNLLIQGPKGGEGRKVKLIDFGLATLATDRVQETGGALGTPPFTAPEFALRRGIDSRSDLYSVGVLLYLVLGRRSPFPGADPVQILNRQLQGPPVPLRELNPLVPKELSRFVQGLLDKDPEARGENPRVALQAFLAAIGESVTWPPSTPVPAFSDPELLFRPEIARELLAALTRGGCWAITGEKGSGKSFLGRWLQRQAWLEGKRVALLRGEELLLLDRENFSEATLLVIDDAEAGPTRSWIEGKNWKTLVLFATELPWTQATPAWNRVKLKPLGAGPIREILAAAAFPSDSIAVEEWEARSQGIPARLVEEGRRRLGRGVPEDLREKLAGFLAASRISLDPETLAAWTGASVQEVQERLAALSAEGILEKRVIDGQAFFHKTGGDVSVETLDPVHIKSLLEALYNRGRYEAGLQLWEEVWKEAARADSEAVLWKARFLTQSGRNSEIASLLTPHFLAELDPQQRAISEEVSGKTALAFGSFDEAETRLKTAARGYESQGDAAGLARAHLHLGILAQRKGEFLQARANYEQALPFAASSPHPELLEGALHLNLANLLYDSASYEAAEAAYADCLPRLQRARHGPLLAQANMNRANCSFYLGRQLQAEHLAREALRHAVTHGYRLTQGYALLLLAMIEGRREHSDRQVLRLNEAVEVLEPFPFERTQARISRAYYWEAHRDLDRARDDAEAAHREAESIRAADLVAQSELILGKILRRDPACLERARECLARSRRHFAEQAQLQLLWECEWEAGELERLAGRKAEAAAAYAQALADIDRLTETLTPSLREAFLRDGKRRKVEQALGKLKGVSS